MDNLFNEPIIITFPPRRVSRRNYQHPARQYRRAARRAARRAYQRADDFAFRRLMHIAQTDPLNIRQIFEQSTAIAFMQILGKRL